MNEPEIDDYTCVDRDGEPYPEHDYEELDEQDGIISLLCRRCGAEGAEDTDGEDEG
jgi:hypothetical protein